MARNDLVLDPACQFCGRRFGRGQITPHESKCRTGSGRFVILAVTGRPIRQGKDWATPHATTEYSVLDSLDSFHEIPIPKPKIDDERRRKAAETVARRRNYQDALDE